MRILEKNSLREMVLECVDEFTLIELLKGILRFPSFPGEETECAEYIAYWMEERGFDTELMEVEEGRFQPVGRLRGTGEGPVLVFNGHMDISYTEKEVYVPGGDNTMVQQSAGTTGFSLEP